MLNKTFTLSADFDLLGVDLDDIVVPTFTNTDLIEDGNKVVVIGKACHGSTPELGDNAALTTLLALGEIYNIPELTNLANKLSENSAFSDGI